MTDSSNFLVSEAQLQLGEARKQKSERIKDLGSPIQLSGKALDIQIRDNIAWIAENTAVARKLDLRSGKTLQLYKGHKGPVTSLAFCDSSKQDNDSRYLITGSWDKSINIWDTDTKELMSTTADAHSDFVKGLFVVPEAELLVSSGSDKIIRFWDVSKPSKKKSLDSTGSISAHTRPVECLSAYAISPDSVVLYTADTMGLIICWKLDRNEGSWRAVKQSEYNYHRTRVNDIVYGSGQLWTASSDDTIQVLIDPTSGKTHTLSHPTQVRAILHLSTTELLEPYVISGAGDVIFIWDVTDSAKPELMKEFDAHWHDITAIRFWKKTEQVEGTLKIEPMIISTSLDGTLRRWKLIELLTSNHPTTKVEQKRSESVSNDAFEITEDEQRELDELMGSD